MDFSDDRQQPTMPPGQTPTDAASAVPADPPTPPLPTLADLRSVSADLDDIDETLARLDADDDGEDRHEDLGPEPGDAGDQDPLLADR